MNRENRNRQEFSEVLTEKSSIERKNYPRELNAYIYTESKRISDKEMEILLKEKNQQVYKKRY